MGYDYKCHRCGTFAEVTTVGSEDLCIACMEPLITEKYHDRISTMAFDLLLLKLEIEELNKEVNDLMRDKIELSCELAMVNA